MTATEEFLDLFKTGEYEEYKLIEATDKKYYYKLKHLKCGTEFVINSYRFMAGRRCHNKECIKEKKLLTKLNGKSEIKKRIKPKGSLRIECIELINKLKSYQFITEVNNITGEIKHISCGNIFKMKYSHFLDGQRCPRKECYSERRKKTNIEKYGVENVSKSTEIQKKKEETTLKNYGVTNPFQAKKIKDKIKKTNLIKYGVENPNYSKEIQEKKRKKTWLKTYNKYSNLDDYTALFTEENFKGVFNTYGFKCNKCGNEFKSVLTRFPRCLKCYPLINVGVSNTETEMADYIEEKIKIERNKRFNRKKFYDEVDVFIEEKKVGFELDGIYWHSEIAGSKNREYHINKNNNLNELGIKLFHIFDAEWLEKKDIIKSIILAKLGLLKNNIYARKCLIKEIDNKKASIFFNENHLQGKINSSINIGLFFNDELVSCLSFSKPRFNKEYKYEITRFASKIFTNITGGFSRLLKYFIRTYNTSSIITYADRRFSDGRLYLKNGFVLKQIAKPNYFYTKDYQKLESREKYQKHKLINLLDNFNPDLTEWENMQINGYDRIWDCGNLVFEYNKEVEV